MQLFRQEVVEQQRSRLLGDVIIEQPLRLAVFTVVLAMTALLGGGLFLMMGNVSQQQSVRGSLVPTASAHQMLATSPGLIHRVHVDQGALVEHGTPLVTIRKRSTTTLSTSNDRPLNGQDGDFYTLKSPRAGTITRVNVHPGDGARRNQPLLEIRGEGDPLMVELVVPPGLITLIGTGQSIDIHYDVFGDMADRVHQGTIERISAGIYMPGQRIGSLQLEEPAYKASVRLKTQTIAASDQIKHLQPGMTLRADVRGGERSLFETLLSSRPSP